MAVSGKAIKQRIKSVKNTKKITKAMEMVSAAKMRKAIQYVTATRTYALLARELMDRLGTTGEVKSSLTEVRPVKKALVILFSSNRGLAGSFNTNVFKKTHAILTRADAFGEVLANDAMYDIIGVGKRSAYFAKRYNYPLVAAYDAIRDNPTVEDILPIARFAIEKFKSAEYDAVLVAYTDFKSSIVQIPRVRKLLPISKGDIESVLEEMPHAKNEEKESDVDVGVRYEFEPSAEMVMEMVLPRLFEVQLYQTLLESRASEHSARMVAMKNATEAAGDMIDGLTVEFNKARQAGITKEIAEIAGGAAALEN
jgi:F-type H+-transporting ATPase subunit gamma